MRQGEKRFVISDFDGFEQVCNYITSQNVSERPWEVIVRPYVRRRTLPQNDRLHAQLRAVADYTGSSLEEVKDEMVERFLGMRRIVILGKLRYRPVETSGLTVVEMSDFMEQVDAFCAEWNIAVEVEA